MPKEGWASSQIEVEVSGLFTTHHRFEAVTGTLGEFTIPAFSQQAIYRSASGRELHMRKTSWLGSSHELLDGELVRGTAERRGLLSRGTLIHLDNRTYVLEPEGLLSRGWHLLDADGTTVLEIRPSGIFRQGAYLTVRGSIDGDLIVFAYYLVHMRQQEEAATATAVN
jgi:hypothetical protein